MRARNPWVFRRRRLFGWNVRFMDRASSSLAVKAVSLRKGAEGVKKAVPSTSKSIRNDRR